MSKYPELSESVNCLMGRVLLCKNGVIGVIQSMLAYTNTNDSDVGILDE